MSSAAGGERELERLLAGMQPVLDPARYAFCRRPGTLLPPGVEPLGWFRETEGVTVILEAHQAERAGFVADFTARRIVLTIHSDLEAVGFLARVGAALFGAAIPANAVSAAYHDHLFVPEWGADRALAVLLGLQEGARGGVPETIYAVTVRIDRDIAEEWLGWMRTVHLPDILATGCFTNCEIQRTIDPADTDGRITFYLEYRSPSLGRYRTYQREHAPALQRAHTGRYAGRFEATRALRVSECLRPPCPPPASSLIADPR